MSLFDLIMIGISLSMDAFAVSICKGLSVRKVQLSHALICGAAGKACRDLPLDDLRPGNFIRQHFNSFVSRVDAFPSERVKACN